MTDQVLSAAAGLPALAAEAGLTSAQLAVAWVLQNPAVSAAIIGASRPEQVRENAAAAGVRLDADLMRKIDELLGDVIIRDPSRTASPAKRP
jgi:aryl-alcohol dehydrogenase-like predicted oxidoreductase